MNKKHLSFMLIFVLCLTLMVCLSACGENNNNNKISTPKNEDNDLPSITGVTFENITADYDGTEKSIFVSGLPEGASVTYTSNIGKNAGTYNATAVITKKGFKTLILNAVLTINKLNFTGITFDNKTLVYDGNEHSILVSGVPVFAEVTYIGTRTATNAGVYNASVKISADNYNDLILKATLTINKATLGEFTFNDETFEYDSQKHTIAVTGLIPSGESVTYSGGEDNFNSAIMLEIIV